MKIAAIRQAFLDYYKQLGHEIVPSSSLFPVMMPPCYLPTQVWFSLKTFF